MTVSSFPLVCMLFATTAIMTTSSRMCYAFARYVHTFPRREFSAYIPQRWWPTCVSFLFQGPPKVECAFELSLPQLGSGHHLWLYLPRL